MPGRPRFTLTDNVLCKQLAGTAWILMSTSACLQSAAASPLTVPRSALTHSSFGAGAASRPEAELEQWPKTLQQIMKAQGLTQAMPVQARSVQCCSPSCLLEEMRDSMDIAVFRVNSYGIGDTWCARRRGLCMTAQGTVCVVPL